MTTPTILTSVTVSPGELAKVQSDLTSATAPVLTIAQTITVTNGESYLQADDLLSHIRNAKAKVNEKMEPIIRPIRQGLDQLYALRRELEGPLDDAEKAVKRKMADWQVAERRRVELEQAERDRVQREETEKVQRRLAEERRQEAERQLQANNVQAADEVLSQPLPQVTVLTTPVRPVVRAQGSTARTVTKWRVTDFAALVCEVAVGNVPMEVLMVNEVEMNRLVREGQGQIVGEWPGVEVYQDVQIAGR